MNQQFTPQQQILVERQKNPHHQGNLAHHQAQAEATNALCGDQLSIEVAIAEGKISQIAWQGQGCIISQAGADLSIDSLIGQTIPQIQSMTEDDFIDLLPIPIRPSRRKCALLLQQCLQQVKSDEYKYE